MAKILLTNLKVMMNKELSTKIVNCTRAKVAVRGCGHVVHVVNMHYLFENVLLYSQEYIKKERIFNNDGQGMVCHNLNFMIPGAWIVLLRSTV